MNVLPRTVSPTFPPSCFLWGQEGGTLLSWICRTACSADWPASWTAVRCTIGRHLWQRYQSTQTWTPGSFPQRSSRLVVGSGTLLATITVMLLPQGRSPSMAVLADLDSHGWSIVDLAQLAHAAHLGIVVDTIREHCKSESLLSLTSDLCCELDCLPLRARPGPPPAPAMLPALGQDLLRSASLPPSPDTSHYSYCPQGGSGQIQLSFHSRNPDSAALHRGWCLCAVPCRGDYGNSRESATPPGTSSPCYQHSL